MKEIEDDSNRWKYILCSWIGRINVANMIIPSKAIYRFSASPIKIPRFFFHRTRPNNLKNLYENTEDPVDKIILRKENRAGSITLLEFRLYYRATVIKIVLYWHKNRDIMVN